MKRVCPKCGGIKFSLSSGLNPRQVFCDGKGCFFSNWKLEANAKKLLEDAKLFVKQYGIGSDSRDLATASFIIRALEPATPAPIAEKPCECMTVYPQFCPKHGIKPVAPIAAQTEKVCKCGHSDNEHDDGRLCCTHQASRSLMCMCEEFSAAEQVDAARLDDAWQTARKWAERPDKNLGFKHRKGCISVGKALDCQCDLCRIITMVMAYHHERAASLKQETQLPTLPSCIYYLLGLTSDDWDMLKEFAPPELKDRMRKVLASSSPLETPAAVPVAEIAGIPNVPAMVHQAERFDDKAKAWAEELHEIIFDPVSPDNDAIETIALTLKNFAESEIAWRNAGK